MAKQSADRARAYTAHSYLWSHAAMQLHLDGQKQCLTGAEVNNKSSGDPLSQPSLLDRICNHCLVLAKALNGRGQINPT